MARRPRNSIGVMTRWVLARRGVFSAYAMRASFSSSIRSCAKGGPGAIANQALTALVVVCGDAHGTVNVEAVKTSREACLSAVQALVGTVLGRERAAKERATREREVREFIDGRGRWMLVAAIFRRAGVEIAVSAKPGEGAVVDTSNDIDDVGLCGRRRFVHANTIAVLLENRVDVK